MTEDLTGRLLSEQRKRLIASILGSAESSNWWSKLNPGEQRAFREKVINAVGVFYDFCRDVVKVTSDDSMRNDLALDLIRQVHDGQRALERQLRTRS